MQAFWIALALAGCIHSDPDRIYIGYSHVCPKEITTNHIFLTQETSNGRGILVHRASNINQVPVPSKPCVGMKTCAVSIKYTTWMGAIKTMIGDTPLTAEDVQRATQERRYIVLAQHPTTLLFPNHTKFVDALECDVSYKANDLGTAVTPTSAEYTAWGFQTLQELQKPRIVAVGDLHGDVEYTVKTFEALGLIDADKAWLGGPKTTFVQTGDVIDRGPDVKSMFGLLQSLRTNGMRAGSAIHLLNGNHEIMKVRRNWSYMHTSIENDPIQFKAFKDAFLPNGEFYNIVAGQDVAVNVDGNVFCHGGISPEFTALGIDEINHKFHALLRPAAEAAIVAEQQQQSVHAKTVQPRLQPLTNFVIPDFKNRKNKVVKLVRRAILDLLDGEDSPTRNRHYAMESESTACALLDQALQTMHAKRMVIGHTPQVPRKPVLHCKGKLVLIDIALSRYMASNGGHIGGIEIRGDRIRAMTDGGWQVLQP